VTCWINVYVYVCNTHSQIYKNIFFLGAEDDDDDEMFYADFVDGCDGMKAMAKRKLSGKMPRESYHCRKYE
jgi:hypothetical protein